MRAYGWMVVGLLLVGMGGCSREEPGQDQTGQEQSDPLPADNVFSEQTGALDKAKDVQNTLDGAAVRTRESVERQERP